MPKENDWYNNKELFEIIQKNNENLSNNIQALLKDMQIFSLELKETRILISKYNGLREKIENLENIISNTESESKGKQQAFEYIRKWTPWVITIISIIYACLQIGDIL